MSFFRSVEFCGAEELLLNEALNNAQCLHLVTRKRSRLDKVVFVTHLLKESTYETKAFDRWKLNEIEWVRHFFPSTSSSHTSISNINSKIPIEKPSTIVKYFHKTNVACEMESDCMFERRLQDSLLLTINYPQKQSENGFHFKENFICKRQKGTRGRPIKVIFVKQN